MKFLSEKKAENFLEKSGFEVIERFFIKSKYGLINSIKKLGFPLVMKVSGKKIIHKKKIEGVAKDVKTYSEALYSLRRLKKIKGSQGVLIQRKILGKEILIGVKKTPEFGHAIIFGNGGSDVEKEKDFSSRIYPFDKNETRKMIRETKIGKTLSKKEKLYVIKNIQQICTLLEKNPQINELDLNPLIISEREAKIVDARILFD